MKIKALTERGKWRTLYTGIGEKKAKDLMKDIFKNLTTDPQSAVNLSQDGMRITGMARGNQVEYVIQ